MPMTAIGSMVSVLSKFDIVILLDSLLCFLFTFQGLKRPRFNVHGEGHTFSPQILRITGMSSWLGSISLIGLSWFFLFPTKTWHLPRYIILNPFYQMPHSILRYSSQWSDQSQGWLKKRVISNDLHSDGFLHGMYLTRKLALLLSSLQSYWLTLSSVVSTRLSVGKTHNFGMAELSVCKAGKTIRSGERSGSTKNQSDTGTPCQCFLSAHV